MTVAAQPDQEIVVGVVQGIVQKGQDRWQIEVNVGQQNPRRLWTKDPTLVQQMMGMIGQSLSFMCGVSHWTNNQNQPVRSLWINGFGAPGQQQPQPMPQQPVAAPVQQWTPPVQQPMAAPMPAPVQAQPDQREQKIHRQTATKVAVELLRYLTPEHQTFDNLLKMSERLVHYYDNGVAWPQGNPGDGTVGQVDQDPGPTGIPHTDDDIPF